MTRREMFKSIRKKLGLKPLERLPKPDKIPDKILLEVGIEKWKDMKNHIEDFSHHWDTNNSHYPYAENCPLCYKYINNYNLVCPLSPDNEPCYGNCIDEYGDFTTDCSIYNINKVVKRLEKEFKKEK